jgi:nucleoside-diphosphate-sugar epimerase
MNILITGSNGFLGRELVNQLSSNTIFKLNRNVGDYHFDLSTVIPSFENSFDLVLHNAGKAHSVPRTREEKEDFFKVNVVGTKNLLKGLETSIPKQFVFISSVSVYGLDHGEFINENNNLLAKDPYGLSKIEAENLVQEWCKKFSVICTILRLPLVVGANPPGNLGAMIKGINKGYYFNIGGGVAKKSMVLAKDAARFIPIIATVGGTYNLTDGEHPSFTDLSHAIAKKNIKNLPLTVVKIMGCIGDFLGERAPINSLKIKRITSNLTFDDSKARSFGWKPQSVIEYLKNNDL